MKVRGNLDVKGSKLSMRFAHFRDEKAINTSGDALLANVWNTRTLNTFVYNSFAGVTLDTVTNRVTLPADTYYIEALATAYQCQGNKLRIYDITGSTVLLVGQNVYSDIAAFGEQTQVMASLKGVITLLVDSVIELQHLVTVQSAVTNEGGLPVNITDTNEVYVDLLVTNY